MNESVEDDAPPKVAARPPPLPDCIRMMTINRIDKTVIVITRKLNIVPHPHVKKSAARKPAPEV
jgi:hypothetical protein